MEKRETVSVVMSVYNGAADVADAVQSILQQTLRDFTFVIVDDGSTDDTPNILARFAREDERIVIVTKERNGGLTAALIAGVEATDATYIARMDADDIALADRLEKQVAHLKAHPDVGLLGSCFYEITGERKRVGERRVAKSHDAIMRVLLKYNPFLHSAVMFRRDVYEQVGGYDSTFLRAQDYDLWLRMATKTRCANLLDVLLEKRYSTHMISMKKEKEQIAAALRARKAALKRKQFPVWQWVHLLRPFLAMHAPDGMKRLIRKYLLKNKMYA